MTNFEAIDWNHIEDPVDLDVWDRLKSNFWVPEKIALSNDLKSWDNLPRSEKERLKKVFVGLTLLDTLQGEQGAPAMQARAKTKHEAAVFANISFMEAFAGGTELLTPSGWKKIEDVKESDLVAQYDPDTGRSSFVNPKVIDPHFSQEVYEISGSNGNARQVVSGGHRVLIEEKVKKTNACKDWKAEVYEARDVQLVNLKTAHRRIRVGAPAQDGVGMTAIDRLLVAVNADGTFGGERYTGEKVGAVPVYFTFHKSRKSDRLAALAQEAGWELRVRGEEDGGRRRHYTLMVPMSYTQDGRKKEMFGWWSLDNLSRQWCEEFIQEVGLWDGHSHSKYEVSIHTTSKADSDFIVAAATLAGLRPRTVKRVDDRSETFNDTWMTYIPREKSHVNTQSVTIKRVEPQMVYCVQVPSTFLITRNGLTPVVSGNCIHAQSYSSIFSTFCSSQEIIDLFEWAKNDEHLQAKARAVARFYLDDHPEQMLDAMQKAASVLLESFLFYSGFYLPLKYSSESTLTNTADIIRLIMRDEGVHGFYIGYKYQQIRSGLNDVMQGALDSRVRVLANDLFNIEMSYTDRLYEGTSMISNVKRYLRYNYNKALDNLGYRSHGWKKDDATPESAILSQMAIDANETHDFFSGSGSSYVVGKVEETDDDDWS